MKRPTSEYGKTLSKTYKPQVCKGCGRRLPKGSYMLIWQVWIDYQRHRFRLCSDCQKIIYGCKDRPPLCHQEHEWIVRGMCQSCDEFPFCDKVEYLRNSVPNDIYLGDVAEVWEEKC